MAGLGHTGCGQCDDTAAFAVYACKYDPQDPLYGLRDMSIATDLWGFDHR